MRDVVVKDIVDGDVMARAAIELRAWISDVADPHADSKVDVLGQRVGSMRSGQDPGLVEVWGVAKGSRV